MLDGKLSRYARRHPITPRRHLSVIKSSDLERYEQPDDSPWWSRPWLLIAAITVVGVGAVVVAAYLGSMP